MWISWCPVWERWKEKHQNAEWTGSTAQQRSNDSICLLHWKVTNYKKSVNAFYIPAPHKKLSKQKQKRRSQVCLTRGAWSFILFLLLFFIVVLSPSFSPCFSVTVGVLGLQHVDGGGAGPAAVVGEPASPAAPRALGRGLYPLCSEGSSKLLRSLLWNEKQEIRVKF